MKLTRQQLRIFPRIQRKYNVSVGFLKSNWANVEKFLWYALSPRLVIKRIAVRKGNNQRIVLDYYHLRRVLFDQTDRKVIKTRRRNVQQWSRQMVSYLRGKFGVKEYVEIRACGDCPAVAEHAKGTKARTSGGSMAPEEVSKQLKEQLELLRSRKRIMPLIDGEAKSVENLPNGADSCHRSAGTDVEWNAGDCTSQITSVVSNRYAANDATNSAVLNKTDYVIQSTLETTPEKQIMGRVENHSEQPKRTYKADKGIDVDSETVELPSSDTRAADVPGSAATLRPRALMPCAEQSTSTSGNSNFLDMLMNKMRSKNVLTEPSVDATVPHSNTGSGSATENFINKSNDNELLTDSSEEFFGFDETERLPGMMITPVVPYSAQSKGDANVAFVSESLNEFMRENLLENSACVAGGAGNAAGRKHRQATLNGLVTPDCVPPRIDMPLVPESLQKLRTVAERRQYLQKFSRNHKLAIINNEAAICRELQRKMRLQKSKSVSQQLLQAPNAQMPFTRQGWQAASFVTTEFNHYYYQTLEVNDGQERELLRLPGVRGNNEERNKKPYCSRVLSKRLTLRCNPYNCCDALVWRDLKPVKTEPDKKKLNKSPLPSVFKPCPLSHKPFQKPLDDETAPLLLAGSSITVVRMPNVELEVFPALGKPLHDVAKRYLEYILPHCDITREWAEFSVSTLQQSMDDGKSNVSSNDLVDGTNVRNESFTFSIPYLNDRSHILVRRVVDRSEKLDETFETATSALEDLSFRANIDQSDDVLVDCADALSEMINSVAISCSENSFIKTDPDGLDPESNATESKHEQIADKSNVKDDKNAIVPDDSKTSTFAAVANKKQNRLLLELRRLNATIIDAAVKAEKEARPCTKEYCALGCICKSLADDYPLRQHCGKSKCVIECTCKGSTQSRIMRLDNDGRSITTEDAFMLRRKATARLARMEKEFTSTIVLTENETLFINESQYDKKRRCTKVPKRYEDFADTDDDYMARSAATTPPKKAHSAGVVMIEAATDNISSAPGFSETTTELREPIYVKHEVMEQLKHCTVPLMRFEDTRNMAVWCMVHELYKCYCGGRATEGKALVIEKDTGNNTNACGSQANISNNRSTTAESEYMVTSTKARYSFEKVEQETEEQAQKEEEKSQVANEKVQNSNNKDSKTQGSVVKSISTDNDDSESELCEETSQDSFDSDFNAASCAAKRRKMTMHRCKKRGRPSEKTFLDEYFSAESDACRRVVVVPRKTYLRMNRKRRAEVQYSIAQQENKQTMLLLNEHILRSVYYHKHEVEKQRKETAQESLLLKRKDEGGNLKEDDVQTKESTKEPLESATKKQLNDNERPIVELIDDDSHQSSLSSLLSTSSGKQTSSTRASKRRRQRSRHLVAGNKIQRSDTDNVVEESNSAENSATAIPTNEEVNEGEVVNNAAEQEKSEETQTSNPNSVLIDDAEPSSMLSVPVDRVAVENFTDVSSATSESSSALSLGAQTMSSLPRSRQDFFRDVVRSMNSLVNKKMQDIGLALKRESKVIPAPNNEILCIIKWSNFLDAFIEGFVFIWQVKLRNEQTFFAATISNMMPMVVDAVGVVNIAALPLQQLPLLGRMLLQRCRSQQTRDLAIVMQGRTKYWLVKGFLRSDKSSACAKPTPKSHPLLTRKINILSSLLAKQHIRELNKKMSQSQREQQPDTSEVEEVAVISTRNVQPQQESQSQPQTTVAANYNDQTDQQTSSNRTPNQVASEKKSHLQQRSVASASTAMSLTTNTSKKLTSLSLLQELIGNSDYMLMKTNIAFRKVTATDIDELHGLDISAEPHRWLVLDLYNDFSHIYVPDFRELVSLDRIHKVMAFSRQKQKIVKMQFFQNAPYDAFVTPSSRRKMYFGPLKLNMKPPLLILLQSVDGQMMLRETYQQQHNIQVHFGEYTTAFWMLRINGQAHFEYEPDNQPAVASGIEEEVIRPDQPMESRESRNVTESDDDDCLIVEDEPTLIAIPPLVAMAPPESAGTQETLKPQPNIAVKSIAELQASGLPPTSARQLTNFAIQTSPKTNRLEITNLSISSSSAEASATQTPVTPLLNTTPESATTQETVQSQSNIAVKPIAELQVPAQPATAARQLTNFAIQTSPTSNRLEITNLSITSSSAEASTTETPLIPLKLPINTQLIPLAAAPPQQQIAPLANQQSSAILCGLPPNAVITGVTPAPQEAPYGTTIFISSLSTAVSPSASEAQLSDKQVAALAQSNSVPSTAKNIANSNATAITTTSTAKVSYLTPDVRVTATDDAVPKGAPSTSALPTPVASASTASFSLPRADGQMSELSSHDLASSSACFTSTKYVSIVRTAEMGAEQSQLLMGVKGSVNTVVPEWKRFLLDETSTSSTIGSTTITKRSDSIATVVRKAMSVDGPKQPITLEEDAFEPAASIVFKSNISTAAMDSNDQPPTKRLRCLAPKGANSVSGSNKYPINGIHMPALTTTSTTTTTTTTTDTRATPMKVVLPHTTSAATLTAKRKTKPQMLTLPLRTLPPQRGQISTKKVTPTATVVKVPLYSHGSNKIVSITTAATTSTSALKITASSTTNTNTPPASTKAMPVVISKPKTLPVRQLNVGSQQYFMQQLPMPSPSTKPPNSHRLSLPPSSCASTTTVNTTMPALNTSTSPSVPRPLIHIRPAVPIPQRTGIAAAAAAQRRSDAASLGAGIVNKGVGCIKMARLAANRTIAPQKKTVTKATTGTTVSSATRALTSVLSKNSTIIGSKFASKSGSSTAKNVDEQYGVFCWSNSESSPKFWAKRVNNSYIIKVPGVSSAVQRSDLESVDTYLNQYLLKQSPAMKSRLPVKWKFVPSEQMNLPIKVLTTNKDGGTIERLLVRRVKVAENSRVASTLASPSPARNLSKDAANAAAAASSNKCSEPILIED